MIKSVVFNSKINNIEEGFKIEFNKPITFLVGDNGAGKSTLLHSLYAWQLKKDRQKQPLWLNVKFTGDITVEHEEKDELFIIDGNTQNYQNRGVFDDNMQLQIEQMWCSNGQATIKAINDGLVKNKKKNILIGDEIDAGLSLASVYYYVQLINVLSTQKQIILATHNTVFLDLQKMFPNRVDVYDFNARSYVEAEDYMKKARKEGLDRMAKTFGI